MADLSVADYEMFDRQVERKMKHSGDAWFHVGWDGMVEVCEDKVNAGTLEKRYNEDLGRLEFRAL